MYALPTDCGLRDTSVSYTHLPSTIDQKVGSLVVTKDRDKIKEMAKELADSLSLRPIELLAAHIMYKDNFTAELTLYDMMARYSEIIRSENVSQTEKAIQCVNRITEPDPQEKYLSNEMKIKFIVYGLDLINSDVKFQDNLIDAAKQHGNEAMIEIIDAWHFNRYSKGLLNAIIEFKHESISYLINKLGEDDSKDELLAHIGKPAFDILLLKMKSKDMKLRYDAADVLVKMFTYNPDVVSEYIKAIENKDLNFIKNNYPFYLRLEYRNLEDLLLKVLDRNFSVQLCEEFMNYGTLSTCLLYTSRCV